jgi:hypothetical protein
MELSGQHHASAALVPGKYPSVHSTRGWVVRSAGRDLFGEWLNLLARAGNRP